MSQLLFPPPQSKFLATPVDLKLHDLAKFFFTDYEEIELKKSLMT